LELAAQGVHVRLRADLHAEPPEDGSAGGAAAAASFSGSIRLSIATDLGPPATIAGDSIWLIGPDSIVAGVLTPSAELARLDQGPWFRTQRLPSAWPHWVSTLDRIDVVTRVVRGATVLGYVRAAGQAIQKSPAPVAAHPVAGVAYLGVTIGDETLPLQGGIRNGAWEKREVGPEGTPPGQPLHAITSAGQEILIRIEPAGPRISWYDSVSTRWLPRHTPSCADSLGAGRVVDSTYFQGPALRYRVECSRRLMDEFAAQGYPDVALFWTGELPVHPLAHPPTQLDSGTMGLLEREASRLWSEAVVGNPPMERPSSLRIGARRVERVVGVEGIVTAWFQVLLQYGEGPEDPRGGAFIVYDLNRKKIVYSTFGHPEWNPRSDIHYVRPYLYFRVGSDPTVYCLTQYDGAWESSGMAVFDVVAGRPVITSR
jgi:hypothetical protein